MHHFDLLSHVLLLDEHYATSLKKVKGPGLFSMMSVVRVFFLLFLPHVAKLANGITAVYNQGGQANVSVLLILYVSA